MTDTPDSELRRFSVKHDGPRRTVVTLDGYDVTDKVYGWQVNGSADPKQPYPTVILELAPNGAEDAAFDGLARVFIGEQAEPDPGPAAARFLRAMDPATLEQAALNDPRLSNERHGMTTMMLTLLTEFAEGKWRP